MAVGKWYNITMVNREAYLAQVKKDIDVLCAVQDERDALRSQLAAMSRDILVCQTKLVAQEEIVRVARLYARCCTTFNRDALKGALAQYGAALVAPKEPKG